MKLSRLLRIALPLLLVGLIWLGRDQSNFPTLTADSQRDVISQPAPRRDISSSKAPADFQEWILTYQNSPDKVALRAGIALAKARREVLKELIQTNPERALRLAIPTDVRAKLPKEIVAQLETPVSAAGNFERIINCYTGGLQRTWDAPIEECFVTFDDQRYRAFTYGRRSELQTKDRISLIGITLDDVLALSPDPARRVSDEDDLVVEAFGEEKRFADEEELDRYVAMLISDESAPGPESALPADDQAPPVSNSPWTEGGKTMLYLRVRFADQDPAYEPVSLATVQSQQADVEEYFRIASYGKLILTTEFTDVISLPQDKAAYVGQGLGLMMNEARDLAITLGDAQGKDWDYNNYDLYTIVSDGGIGSYAGVAQVGGRKSHLQKGYTSLRTAGHEFGHNLGLSHAYYNYTSDLNPRGDTPTNGLGRVEYGHRFSVMSAQSGSDFSHPAIPHFTVHEKWRLDWLTDSDFTDLTSGSQSGTYRLYQNDDENATCLRALRVPSGGALSKYWLSYRTAWRTPNRTSDNDYLLNGIVFDWTGSGGGTSTLLDMTPYSDDGSPTGADWARDNDDKWDAPLLIGRTYTDEESLLSVTPVARGGIAPNEYIDVYVHLATGAEIPLVGENDPCGAIVPDALTATGTDWTGPGFDDSGWPFSGNLGVGYDTNPDYDPYFSVDVQSALRNLSESCYIRIPFTLGAGVDPATISALKLKIRYDDGFVAYLNGVKIAEANAPGSPAWNSGATTTHNDGASIIYEEFSANTALGALVSGTNILAIHGLNSGTNSSDFLIQPTLTAVLSAAPNSPPEVSLDADTLVAAINQDVTFTATGSDPDGDVLAYSWDFDIGDAFAPEGLNQPAAVRRWTTTGYYTVTVTCSDRKGGIARDRALVKVGVPGNDGLIRGRVLQGGIPVAGARVFIQGGDRQCLTLDDGSYVMGGLANSSELTLGAMFDGEVFQPSVAMPITPAGSSEEVDFLGHSSTVAGAPSQMLTVSPNVADTDTASSLPLTARIWNNTQSLDDLIPLGDTWRYLDTGVDPGATWTTAGFDDSAWLTGAAELGYGDSQTTEIGFGGDANNKHITSWFRRTFTVVNPLEISRLKLSVKRDDGIRIFLNGTEIARDNLTTGTVSATTKALNDVSSANEDLLIHFAIDPSLLVDGSNILAAEVHQENIDNADLSFDLQLSAARNLADAAPLWAVTPSGASVTSSGIFSATAPGTYTVTATSDGLSATSTINVATDNAVTIAALDSFLWENGSTTATIRLTRSGSTSGSLVVPLSLGGEAIDGIDFSGVPTSLTIPAGALTGDFTITVSDDQELEGREAIFISAVSPGTFSLGDPAVATVTIMDDEYPLDIALSAGPDSSIGVNSPLSLAGSLTGSAQFITSGDYWKYQDNGIAASAGWTGLPFTDDSWSEGLAKFGYGDNNETTPIEFGDSASKHITTYFRRRFYLDDPASHTSLTASLLVDDGAVIYLNGQEAQRVNMPTGVVAFSTRASSAVGGSDETTYVDYTLDPAELISGENIIAVEVHQASSTSSDLGFDLSFKGDLSNPGNVTYQWSQTSGPGTATFSNSASPVSSVSFNQPGVYLLRLEASTQGNTLADEIEITVQSQQSYAQWITGFVLPDAEPGADPDLDGVSNLMEFATGTDPSLGSNYRIPTLISDPANPNELLFTYRRLRAINPGDATGSSADGYDLYGINYTLEASSSLTGWQPASSQLTMQEEGLPTDNGDGSETVTLRLTPTTGLSWFFRLKVTMD